jgi:hypothetical protein
VFGFSDDFANRLLHIVGSGSRCRFGMFAAEPSQQHLPRHNHGVRIGDIASSNIRRRAVGSLRHGLTFADTKSGSDPEPANEPCAYIGEDVTKLIGGDDYIILLGCHHKSH